MFKMLPPTFFVVPVAWIAMLLLMLMNLLKPNFQALGIEPRLTWIVLIIQLLIALFFLTPVWRWLWRLIPQLNELFYPDLNGEWDVELSSNFSRIEMMVDAAASKTRQVDVVGMAADKLPPLRPGCLRARIRQSWVSVDIEIWNPDGNGVIKRSETIIAEPFRGRHGRHGLAYIFDQENETDMPGDERRFRGAAWIVREGEGNHREANALCGSMWTDRMWRRGMNTAATLRLTRVAPWHSLWEMLALRWSAARGR